MECARERGVIQTAADFTAQQEKTMKKIFVAALVTTIAAATLSGAAFAKRGADDPAGHVRHGAHAAGHR